MNNYFGVKYKAKLLLTHVVVAALTVFVSYLLFLVMDYVFNGILLDAVANRFGYRLASFFKQHKELVVFAFLMLVLGIGWIVVEFRAVNKLTGLVKNLNVLFTKDSERLVLSKEFKDIERELNALKFESIRNEQLAEAETQRKADLIAYLAHDIKTPLASVIGYLSLLDEVPDVPMEQRAKYVSITLEKAYRLEQLINEFFDITRFNLTTIPLEKEDIDLKFMLEQMAEEFYPMLAPGGRSVNVLVEDGLTVYADADKLARVFNNILKNAVSYSYKNTSIDINAWSDAWTVTIEFRNRGKKIPEHKINSIFEKFYRLDTARSTYTGGAGLGLAIAKEIVVQHGGRILASSNEEITVFTVKLPVRGQPGWER